jgi:hypothetical protein
MARFYRRRNAPIDTATRSRRRFLGQLSAAGTVALTGHALAMDMDGQRIEVKA